ncbi:erythromycin esterase family protein [Nocardioides sp. SLBN-35]|uniref:erythromycin esterase family protein n=1 Tax=Nocardioides sp. SLBN-35 TaxID=2768445 RepID=UPI00114F2816|nr:erythromycin esterase family protein [Nocardioides sp. SLBN-35]TQK71286.1 erythromycin esterase-like protein [Nocardioides sp. SLBN-35]
MSTRLDALDRAAASQAQRLARPLVTAADLDPLVARLGPVRYACLGEASHGTREFYRWRAELSRRLIEERGFTWIGVEGDWPDCWRVNRWLRAPEEDRRTARDVLADFGRWPTWMWANTDVADFLDWLRALNLARPLDRRVGFYGLDVYSLWDSLREIHDWLAEHAPDALPDARRAWQCFVPYREDPHRYAWATRLVPTSCEDEVVALLAEVRRRHGQVAEGDEDAFAVVQNAEVAANAELYYRTMVRGDRASWNIRDQHMVLTVERIARHLGPEAKGLVWEHNTHIGDARATDMAVSGMVNVGQLLRERHRAADVALVGFAGHRGTVLAASGWGEPERVLPVPEARRGSHEDLLHHALARPAVIAFPEDRTGPWLADRRGHRAIGVVYEPSQESGNYVPTVIGQRYDALIWLERTQALVPLHHEAPPVEPELETEPSGF